jgi:manganese transport protein
MAGQIVMEGFLNFRMRPWLRRLITRLLAIIPAAITISAAGEEGTYKLLILSQVILSMQLPFAVIPLIHFTSDGRRMGEFANRVWVRMLAWTAAAIIVSLNVWLVYDKLTEWLAGAGEWRLFLSLVVVPLALALFGLLIWITVEPVLPEWFRRMGRAPIALPQSVSADLPSPSYRRILVPLDHTARDREAVAHAAAMAKQHHAHLILLHVEEGVTSQVYGALSSTVEVEAGQEYLEEIARTLKKQQIDVEVLVRHSRNPRAEIIRVADQYRPDLLIMGAHGHKALKDLVFGTTINAVRHRLDIPILVVRNER